MYRRVAIKLSRGLDWDFDWDSPDGMYAVADTVIRRELESDMLGSASSSTPQFSSQARRLHRSTDQEFDDERDRLEDALRIADELFKEAERIAGEKDPCETNTFGNSASADSAGPARKDSLDADQILDEAMRSLRDREGEGITGSG